MTFLHSGQHEDTKLAYHAALGLLALGALAYNACAFLERKEPHLAMNVLLYGALTVLEVMKCAHHAESL